MLRAKCLSAAAVISCSICCLHQSQAFVLKPPMSSTRTYSNDKSTLLHQYENNPRSGSGGSRSNSNSNSNNNMNRNRNNDSNKKSSYQSRGDHQNNTNPPMPRGLESSLTNLFDMSGQGSARKYNSEQNRNMAGSILSTTNPQDDAPLLDENMYINSGQYMDADGSFVGKEKSQIDNDMQNLLSTLMNENPQMPQDDDNMHNIPKGNIVDDQALLESISQHNVNNSIDGEELHKRIFENEQGFLQQSEAFRDTLGPDPEEEKKIEAAALRRGAEYRNQQEETMKYIFKEMEELENSILSMEDARKLAVEQNDKFKMRAILTEARTSDGVGDDDRTTSGQEQDPTAILCSKCACLISGEEIVFERKRGRKTPSEMICRLCQVDNMQVKKGSPYLMGRLGRNGKLPPRMGIPSPPQSKIVRKKVQQIRKIGPRTEDLNEDIYTKPEEAVENNNEKRTEAQSNAWREQYTNAMYQRRGILTNGAASTSSASADDAPKNPPLKENYGQASTANHRYSKRPQELKTHKESYAEKSTWNAHLKAALHRQQGIEQTGIAYTSRSATVAFNERASPSPNLSMNASTNTQSQLSKDTTEVKNLRGQINDMQITIRQYKSQVESSSKQIKAMQSMMEGIKKSTNRPVKRKQSQWNANRAVSDTRARIVKEVGEGIVREIGQSMPKRPVANDDEFYLDDP